VKKLLFLPLFLFAYSTQDTIAFMKWVKNPNAYFNVVDCVFKNGKPNINFPSITTKTANKSFKIMVLKKIPISYDLKLYSYDLNKTVKFNKKLLLKTPNFDVYNVTIPYEYKNLRFQIDYNITIMKPFDYIHMTKEDNSTDNFSVKPYNVKTNDSYTNVFHLLVDNGKSLYYDNGANKNYYTYFFSKGKGIVTFWASSSTKYHFCLNNNWTSIDSDDTPLADRQMPCVDLLLPPNKTGWGGVEVKTKTKFKPLEINNSKNIYIKRIMW